MATEQLNLTSIGSLKETKESPHVESALPSINPLASLQHGLDAIFPTSSEESKIATMRRQLGAVGGALTDEQITSVISELQFLIDTWLDEFEKEVFGGKTLKQVLSNKEYGAVK